MFGNLRPFCPPAPAIRIHLTAAVCWVLGQSSTNPLASLTTQVGGRGGQLLVAQPRGCVNGGSGEVGSEIRPYGYSPPSPICPHACTTRKSSGAPVQQVPERGPWNWAAGATHCPGAGALEHPNPSWCSYLANPGTFAVAIRRPGGPRSKQPTNAVLCQAYPIYPHVTLGRRRPANLRRPNHRLSI